MKKFTYPLLVLGLLIAFGFVFRNYQIKKNAIPRLLEPDLQG